MDFLQKLDMLMAERKIKKSELARQAEIPYTTLLSLYDKGYSNVGLSTLKKLASYFGCSIDYLVDDKVTDRQYGKETLTHTYIKAKESDMAAIRTLVKAIDKLLQPDE